MDDCLDVLVDVLGADRGLLLLHERRRRRARRQRARRRARPHADGARGGEPHRRPRGDRDRAGASRGTRSRPPREQSTSFASLGIVAGARGAALRGRQLATALRGVLYVDFRDAAEVRQRPARRVLRVGGAPRSAPCSSSTIARRRCASSSARRRATAPRPAARRRSADLLAFPSMRAIKREIESALPGSRPSSSPASRAPARRCWRRRSPRRAAGGRSCAPCSARATTSTPSPRSSSATSAARSPGATTKRMGLVEFADGGTLILDEILNLPPHAQQLLLDFTQFGTYRPLGYERAEPKRARVRHHRRDQRRPAGGHPRAALPRGPLLPARRGHARAPAAARAARGHPRARREHAAARRPGARVDAVAAAAPAARVADARLVGQRAPARARRGAGARARGRARSGGDGAHAGAPRVARRGPRVHRRGAGDDASPAGRAARHDVAEAPGRARAARRARAGRCSSRRWRSRAASWRRRRESSGSRGRRCRAASTRWGSASRSAEAGGEPGPRAEGPPALPRVPARSPCDVNRLRPRPTRFSPGCNPLLPPRPPDLAAAHDPLLRRRGST